MKKESLKEILDQLLIILRTEKEALIHNQVEKIEALVAEKEVLAKTIESIELKEKNREDEELIALIQSIKKEQETNLLLTKQAMSYTDTFISVFQKEANKNLTYSKAGKDKNTGKSSILNQSL